MPKPKRVAIIDREKCQPKVCGFYLCQRVCPVNRSKKDCVTVSLEDKKPLIDESLCIGCGICVRKCPKEAINVVNLPIQLDEPTHRYGKNKFVLYKLPVPKKQSVVSLIGQNGIGKTTVLNMLSGTIKPNLGKFETELEWKEIINKFKGSELQSYLEKLSKGLKSAYKPQHVDLIPKEYKGKVKEFLEKITNKKQVESVLKRLNSETILNKNIKDLSGGELQMLAIATTLLKKADFYFFDEPSSYLDVQQRLVMSKEIRKLDAITIVVEHDLAVADYLADSVHILYGSKGVFGIISNPYGVREGINTYLDGYLKEENVRFRENEVKFSKRARTSRKTQLFLEFPSFFKKFQGFSLETAPGEIYKGEVIGILGPNAIGKTTFIKILTGEIKPDKHPLPDSGRDTFREIPKLKLSYKPQRLVLKKTEENVMVSQYIKNTSKKETKNLIRILGLEKLLEHKLGSLSGGELQAVFIVKALSEPHDMLLMDEPSAFLDVEQRLRVSKILKNHAEVNEIPCFIVDHDLQFIDTVSDRLMIFEGKQGINGIGKTPVHMKDGMNSFLKSLGITFRRDPQTGRARANKPDSQLDSQQKQKGEYFYN
ncbi:MAG: ribosome biogenesis/translation initiation ATPase RLI [Candidatus Aenigmarchaeota archaeon]|nr:ribosome biogenesis/translation initiation ATPase RLI [Candidatus Aenigmarchaeota archaeon]